MSSDKTAKTIIIKILKYYFWYIFPKIKRYDCMKKHHTSV